MTEWLKSRLRAEEKMPVWRSTSSSNVRCRTANRPAVQNAAYAQQYVIWLEAEPRAFHQLEHKLHRSALSVGLNSSL